MAPRFVPADPDLAPVDAAFGFEESAHPAAISAAHPSEKIRAYIVRLHGDCRKEVLGSSAVALAVPFRDNPSGSIGRCGSACLQLAAPFDPLHIVEPKSSGQRLTSPMILYIQAYGRRMGRAEITIRDILTQRLMP